TKALARFNAGKTRRAKRRKRFHPVKSNSSATFMVGLRLNYAHHRASTDSALAKPATTFEFALALKRPNRVDFADAQSFNDRSHSSLHRSPPAPRWGYAAGDDHRSRT